ncbi:MAG: hypothetical protein J2P13_04540 [Acidobacteria bacterium]|nr:hypothetical protein [Acidobacteriota bacterium]
MTVAFARKEDAMGAQDVNVQDPPIHLHLLWQGEHWVLDRLPTVDGRLQLFCRRGAIAGFSGKKKARVMAMADEAGSATGNRTRV